MLWKCIDVQHAAPRANKSTRTYVHVPMGDQKEEGVPVSGGLHVSTDCVEMIKRLGKKGRNAERKTR